jgi:hypothetical protein
MANAAERALGLGLALAIALASGLAHAQSASAAEVLFEDGRRLMDAGDYPTACAKLAESQRIDPAGGTLMNLAACHERMGKTATAWAEFNDALAQAKRDGRQDRVLEATRRIADITPRLARVTLSVPAPVRAGFEVRVDGTALGSASWGTALPVDPGDHQLQASAPGCAPWNGHVSVAAGATKELVVPPLAPMAAQDPPPGERAAPSESRPVAAYVVGGVGLVALGVGTYFGLAAAGKKRDSEKECTPGGCTATGAGLLRDANTAAWASNVGFGVGVASLVVATYLFFTSPRRADGRQSLGISPVFGASALGLGANGAW